MRTDAQVNHEISKLTSALKSRRYGFNDETRATIEEQIKVLSLRLTPAQVETRYYVDETSSEYRDGDNLLWTDLDGTARWLAEEEGSEAPSAGL